MIHVNPVKRDLGGGLRSAQLVMRSSLIVALSPTPLLPTTRLTTSDVRGKGR